MWNVKGKKGYIAIKIDLKKVYDRLAWSFIVDTLKEVGLNEHVINIIWHCILSALWAFFGMG